MKNVMGILRRIWMGMLGENFDESFFMGILIQKFYGIFDENVDGSFDHNFYGNFD